MLDRKFVYESATLLRIIDSLAIIHPPARGSSKRNACIALFPL
jgi:hypothetical protein